MHFSFFLSFPTERKHYIGPRDCTSALCLCVCVGTVKTKNMLVGSFIQSSCNTNIALAHSYHRRQPTSNLIRGPSKGKWTSPVHPSRSFVSSSGFLKDKKLGLLFSHSRSRNTQRPLIVVCQESFDYDVAIIGAGVGGHGAALHAVANGLKTCIFEAQDIGGTCVNRGCVPSKALLSSARRIRELRDRHHLRSLGVDVADVAVDIQAVAGHAQGLANRVQKNLGNSLKALGVEVIHSRAKVKSSQLVELANGETIRARDIILAPGSVPFVPPGIQVDNKTVFTSDQALKLEWLPSWIAIIGSGYIGLEFSDVYSSLGTEVTFVEALPNLIPGFDPEISRAAHRLLIQSRPIDYYTRSLATKVIPGQPVQVVLSDADTRVVSRELQVDAVLVATGRKPNTENLGLDDDDSNLGIKLARGGFIPTNEYMQVIRGEDQVVVPHLYCIGDANGKMMLAHAASMQGISAIENIMGNRHSVNHRAIPAACFTHPEIAYVGWTEPQARQEASQQGFPLEKSIAHFRANSKALAEMEAEGMAKILFNAQTGEVGTTQDTISISIFLSFVCLYVYIYDACSY